jgi:valyl-tRNA synthetase
MGLRFMKEVPFYQVHINGIVRDAGKKKMSKTRGNVIEPLELVQEYGADAVRFTLSSMAVPGTDILFSTDRMKGYSAFANKVWNASRFLLMYLKESDRPISAESVDHLIASRQNQVPVEDLWILHRLNEVAAEISESLDKFRFHEASAQIYQFIWHELCDWYIELIKPVLMNPAVTDEERTSRVAILVHVLDCSLRLLHPFMPFITEEIWQKIPHDGESLMVQEFPAPRKSRENAKALAEMQDLMGLITGIRSIRAEMNIDPKKVLNAVLVIPDGNRKALVIQNLEKVKMLTRLGKTEISEIIPNNFLKGVWRSGEFGLDIQGVIDFGAECARLRKEIEQVKGEVDKILRKINNQDFIARAPESVVQENRTRHAELLDRLGKLETNLAKMQPG